MQPTNPNDDKKIVVVPIDPFWLKRWQSLRDSIEYQIPRWGWPYKPLLEALLHFGANHFYYFFLGFGGKVDENSLSETDKVRYYAQKKYFKNFSQTELNAYLAIESGYPPNYVLRVVIDQISRDFETIQRAVYQRQEAHSEQNNTLELADAWGSSILAQFADENKKKAKVLEDKILVITYFNNTTRINLVPYANVALVGIPFTANSQSDYRDLLMLPHELGHFIFHMGKKDNLSIKEYIARELKQSFDEKKQNEEANKKTNTDRKDALEKAMVKALNWTEELFCDVFGIFIGREPAAVTMALSMIADNLPRYLFLDNEVHPSDALRINIYLATIQHIEAELNKANITYTLSHGYLELISKSIITYIKATEEKIIKRGINGRAESKSTKQKNQTVDAHSNELTPELYEVLEKLIEGMVKELLTFANIQNWHSIGAQKYKKQVQIDCYKLADTIQQYPTQLIDGNPSPSPNLSYESIQIEDLYKGFSSRLREIKGASPLPEVKNYAISYESGMEEALDNYSIPCETWIPIFEANGWGVRGPETGPVGG